MKHLKNFNESKNNKLKEYDVVKLKVEVDNIPVGTEGTIVHINKKGESYEVEFVVDGNSTVSTVSNKQIKK